MHSRTFETGFWNDPENRDLSGDALSLYAYLRTAPGGHYSGLFRLQLWLIARESRRTEKQVRQLLDELGRTPILPQLYQTNGLSPLCLASKETTPPLVGVDYATDTLWIATEGRKISRPSWQQKASISRHVESFKPFVPHFVKAFCDLYPHFAPSGPDRVSKPSGYVSDPDTDTDSDPDPESGGVGESEGKGTRGRAALAVVDRRPAPPRDGLAKRLGPAPARAAAAKVVEKWVTPEIARQLALPGRKDDGE